MDRLQAEPVRGNDALPFPLPRGLVFASGIVETAAARDGDDRHAGGEFQGIGFLVQAVVAIERNRVGCAGSAGVDATHGFRAWRVRQDHAADHAEIDVIGGLEIE